MATETTQPAICPLTKDSTIGDLMEFLHQATLLDSADTPRESGIIGEELGGFATGFVAELVEDTLRLNERLTA